MAARLRKNHADSVRAKIQTSQLINRLTDHALGKLDLSPTQVRAIEILMKKTLPDLSATQIEAKVDMQPGYIFSIETVGQDGEAHQPPAN